MVYTGLKERNMGVLISPDSENADATNFRRKYYENAHPEYDQLIAEAMETVWKKKPKPFQADVTKHVLQMGKADKKVAPTLLVRGTGGGKSLVMQTIAVIKGGVTLIIENTLSLSSDQMSKIKHVSEKDGNVIALHLDAIKNDADKKQTKKLLLGLKKLR